MAKFDTWESYFYPSPDEGTLRNIEDIRDHQELRVFEYGATVLRYRQLCMNPSIVPRTYDAEHVRAIHRYLFQDVYEWAGQYRSVNMFKNLSSFADVHAGEIDRYLTDVKRLVDGTGWAGLDREGFARACAEVFAYLNQAHPFREGNGRASKVFMEHVAEQSKFTLNFDRVSPDVWNQASMLSGPDLGNYEFVPDSLVPVFKLVAVPRPEALIHEGGRVTVDAAYEKPMTVGERVERRVNELREARSSKLKHGDDAPELGDVTKPKPSGRGTNFGR